MRKITVNRLPGSHDGAVAYDPSTGKISVAEFKGQLSRSVAAAATELRKGMSRG